MERPSKRPRNGPSPLNRDEVDNDELTLRPEEVNAIRDPGYQLQKSRAVAASKLKSAFERIFEKYEKDFTGVGDEIDLRTGEVVVDNGHLQSLKDSTWLANGDDGGDDDDDTVDEEERILQGKTDQPLSLMRHNPMPLTMQPRPSLFQDQWSSPSPFMGAPPMLSSMSFPRQSYFGSYQMQMPMPYGAPQFGQPLESAWASPDLPPPRLAGAFGPVPSDFARRTKARVPFVTAGEDGDDNEDDLLLGVSASGPSKTTDKVTGVPESFSPSRPNGTKTGTDNIQDTNKAGASVQRAKYKIPEVKKPGPRKRSASRKLVAGSDASKATKNLPANTPVPSSEVLAAASLEATATEASSVAPVPGQGETSSLPGPKTTTRPRIQTIRVEIPTMKVSDRSSFKIINLEASPEPEKINHAEEPAVEAQPPTQEAEVELAPEHQQPPVEEVEIFSRNAIDPAYAFSDEDEPTLPRRKECQSNQKPSPTQHAASVKAATLTPKTAKPKRVAKKIRESLARLAPAEAVPSRILPSPETSSNPASEAHEDADRSEEPPSLLRLRPRRGIMAKVAEDSAASDIPAVSPTIEPPNIDADSGAAHKQLWPGKRKARLSTPSKDAQVAEPPLQRPLCRSPDPPSLALDPSDRVIPETPEASPLRPSTRSPNLRSSPSPDLGIFSSELIPDTQEQDEDPDQSQKQEQLQQPESEPLSNIETLSPPLTELTPADEPKPAPPKTPSSKTLGRFTRPNPTGSSAKAGILSLLSDDEDELSLGPEDFTPSGSRRRNTSLLPGTDTETSSTSLDRVRSFLQGGSSSAPSSARRTTTLTRRGVVVGGSNSSYSHGKPSQFKTPPSRGKTKGRFGALLLSRLSAGRPSVSTLAIRGGAGGSTHAVSPVSRVGSELICTPGGSKRRCGEGDFRCDKDFCFVCLR